MFTGYRQGMSSIIVPCEPAACAFRFYLTCLQRGQMLTPGFIDLHLHAPQVRLPCTPGCNEFKLNCSCGRPLCRGVVALSQICAWP